MRSIALLVSLLATASATAPAAAVVAPEPVLVFLGEDAAGNVVVEVLPTSAQDHDVTCGGIAPIDPATCSTGTHTYANDGSLRHGTVSCLPFFAVFASCGTFTVTSVVSDGVNTRTFYCHLVPGAVPDEYAFVIATCAGSGSFPTADFAHTCSAAAFRGVVPAAGKWDCVVWHN